MTPTPNTQRWERLADFLVETMERSSNKRMRMAAAMRLADLLERRERQEAAEARRQERERLQAAKAQQEAIEREIQAKTDTDERTQREAEQQRERAVERARGNMQKILQKSS